MGQGEKPRRAQDRELRVRLTTVAEVAAQSGIPARKELHRYVPMSSEFVTHSNQQNHCHSHWQVPWGLLGPPVCIALLKAVIKDFTVNSIM